MNTKRRKILKCSSVTSLVAMAEGTGLWIPNTVRADVPKAIPFAKRNSNLSYSFAMKGRGMVMPSREIILNVPVYSNGGSHLPVEVISNIKDTTRIFIVCEPNDWPVIADFQLMNGAESYISTRIRAEHWCNIVTVRAFVHANGIAYGSDLKEVFISDGKSHGCSRP